MSLTVNLKATKEAKQAPKGTVLTRYKLVKIVRVLCSSGSSGYNCVYHRLQSLVFSENTLKPGINRADFEKKPVIRKDRQSVDNAIHVYVDKSNAKIHEAPDSNIVLLPVKCLSDDLIAVGLNNDEVYTKIFIDHTEYNMACALNKYK